MTLIPLLSLLRGEEGFARVAELAHNRGRVSIQAAPGIRPALLAEASAVRPVLVVTATGHDAEDVADALGEYVPSVGVAILPAWETLPHERLSPRSDTVAQRLDTFRRLAHPESGPDTGHGPIRILVVPVRALLQPVVAGLGEYEPVTVHEGDTVDLADLAERLTAAAYTRVDMVERRGEFAVRGGILDVFPPTESHPIRIDLWGDEVESISYFAASDQRSAAPVPHGLWASPCREILLTPGVRTRAAALRGTIPGAEELLDKLAAGVAAEGMESLAPVLADAMESVIDRVPADCLTVVCDPERVRRRAFDLGETTDEFLAAAWSGAAAGGETPIDLSRALSSGSFATYEETRERSLARGLGWWEAGSFGLFPDGAEGALGGRNDMSAVAAADGPDDADAIHVIIGAKDSDEHGGDRTKTIEDVHKRVHDNWRQLILAEGSGSAQRLAEQLRGLDIPTHFVETLDAPPPEGEVTILKAAGSGFISAPLRLAVLSETDLTGRPSSKKRDQQKMPARRKNVVDPLQLKAGDFIVHEQHGVGRFVELVQRTVGVGATAATREYLVIEYAASKRGQPGDRLFVPTDNLDQVTKYVGGEAPALSKMGGTDWAKTKGRARKAVRQIAGELIRLYAARMASPGYRFGQDTPWQRELEDAFPYTETPDQIVTIDEVKGDMEKPVPMDRLICGDVGYGKTEIAVRAAFKAVQDGKQVAVLVPTTLLVQQHMETFSERYAPFPVTVKPLSRFQTPAEAKVTKEGLTDGSVDVVIGTHALLTGGVQFKDLGLVVIDEEQRFGVEHKETFKALRTDVDVLSMSATPIPRTLEMAVAGIREMSTLATPPEDRHPVLTYVGGYENKQVAAAIRRELLRDGQVFYVHNRVEDIERVAAHVHELVPEARVAVAHGKMHEHELERIIVDFWEKRLDVLICTTIIETGLDISNANTLIVDRAERYGLSQLHQLRGRVGRGRERAYAYFLYPTDKPLTETAHDRLATIAANTDLGAGMAVALKDLEIRGAGNLLGGEQSGHIAGVGFDLYIRMVSEAVRAFRNDPNAPDAEDEEPAEVKIELPIDAHIPHEYIDGDRLRLEAYTKLANASDDAMLAEVRDELTDRYGPIPPEVENLFLISRLRQTARAAGVTEITAQGKYVRFFPVHLAESQQLKLNRIHRGTIHKPATRTVLVPAPKPAKLGAEPLRDADIVAWAAALVADVLADNGTRP